MRNRERTRRRREMSVGALRALVVGLWALACIGWLTSFVICILLLTQD